MSEVLGEEEIIRKLAALAKAYPQAAAKALYAEGFAIGALAQDKCPVDESVLEKSMYVSPPTAEGVVEVGFGTEYAVYQHERTELHHPKKGEAKYLQKAVDARMPGIMGRMVARIEQAVEKGGG
jgi:hypothetical protein